MADEIARLPRAWGGSKVVALDNSNSSISIKIVDNGDSQSPTQALLTLQVSSATDIVKHEESEPAVEWKPLAVKQINLMGPIILSHLLDYIPRFVGVILVAHIDSPDTELFVNAVGMSNMFSTLTSLSIGYGMCTALDTLASQAYGAGQHKKIGIYLQTAFIVVFGGCLIPVFLLNWYIEPLLLLVGQEPQVAKLAGEFTRYSLVGTPFLYLFEMMSKLLTAQNEAEPLVWVGLVGQVIGATSGYYLSYHTSLGFHGTAMSTAIGSIAPPATLAFYLAFTNGYQNWWPGWDLKAAWAEVGLFLHLGVPGMLMIAMEWGAYEIMTIMAGVLPNPVLSLKIQVILLSVLSFLFEVFQGVATAGQVLVGNALGANQPKHAQMTTRITLLMVLTLSCIFGVLMFTFRFDIPTLLTQDAEAIERAGVAFLIAIPYSTIDGLYCVIQTICCGLGRQQWAAGTNVVAFYVLGLPLAALFAFHLDLNVEGLWIGLGLGSLSACAVCLYALYRTSWQQMADEAQRNVGDK